jgi:hypothetical protein
MNMKQVINEYVENSKLLNETFRKRLEQECGKFASKFFNDYNNEIMNAISEEVKKSEALYNAIFIELMSVDIHFYNGVVRCLVIAKYLGSKDLFDIGHSGIRLIENYNSDGIYGPYLPFASMSYNPFLSKELYEMFSDLSEGLRVSRSSVVKIDCRVYPELKVRSDLL